MRRKELIQRMEELEGQGLGCSGCQGNCCTYEANSMMVTPLEALELQQYLRKENALTPEFKEKCLETVKKFRLDQGGNGRRSFIRRTYTCPFFNHKELGCPLPREVKPYGCLAFNAHDAELKAGEHCFSEKELLLKRDQDHVWEERKNQSLRIKFKLNWEKSPLPLALLDIWEAEVSDADLSAD
ncbi:MAG TPA: hypothetical protein VNJ08_08625 [Bacteriovoracaceae bacterium]|nr:hypothetical protein [Bacteriovoracaceae bacterium]